MNIHIFIGKCLLDGIGKDITSCSALVTFRGVQKKVSTLPSFNSDEVPIVFNIEGNIDFKEEAKVSALGPCKMKFELLGVNALGYELLLAEGFNDFSVTDHAVSKTVKLCEKNKPDRVLGKISIIVHYYPVAKDPKVEEELNKAMEVKPMRDIEKEYAFLKSRRLNWNKSVPSSFDKKLEAHLSDDAGVRLKEQQKQGVVVKRAISAPKSKISSNGINSSLHKKITQLKEKANAPVRNNATVSSKKVSSEVASPTVPTETHVFKEISSKQPRMFSALGRSRSAPSSATTRKTSMDVGYIGVNWPRKKEETFPEVIISTRRKASKEVDTLQMLRELVKEREAERATLSFMQRRQKSLKVSRSLPISLPSKPRKDRKSNITSVTPSDIVNVSPPKTSDKKMSRRDESVKLQHRIKEQEQHIKELKTEIVSYRKTSDAKIRVLENQLKSLVSKTTNNLILSEKTASTTKKRLETKKAQLTDGKDETIFNFLRPTKSFVSHIAPQMAIDPKPSTKNGVHTKCSRAKAETLLVTVNNPKLDAVMVASDIDTFDADNRIAGTE